jgi:valyl-tRNA synthetase
MEPLPKKYQHREVETKWQSKWHEAQVYAWKDNTSRDESFVIDTPPPTVSGLLHMGHVFSYCQADFVARYNRMKGKNVFYPMGFDDNGLPTERLVEKVKKIRAADLSREEFIGLCEDVSEEARKDFRALFESIALSVDWNQEYHTISEDSRRISQMSFLDLYEKGHAYRKIQPMLWDPVDRTAIAQAEIEDKEMPSTMNDVKFTCLETGEDIVIATTRPELLGACVAVFYHPEDSRYKALEGKTAVTALFGVKVPLLADENVQMEKGTGLVMCCTFGDETDIAWWQLHRLHTRIILDPVGRVQFSVEEGCVSFDSDEGATLTADNVVSMEKTLHYCNELGGLSAKKARVRTLELLEEAQLLLKQEEISHAVKCAERSGAPLEIRPTHQWFVAILDKKDQLKEKAAECNWYPSYMKVRMDQWIDGLSWDWCISRQRYFGVPFPVWYSKRAGEEGKVLLANPEQLPVNPLVDLPEGYSREEVEAEADVMDTWATSSVSPQINSYGISDKYAVDSQRHSQLFPADLRPQAHEIIRTWAFYTVVKAYLHEETIPWKNLMISGWCLASDKSKMSKSKGNVVTPVGLIEEKGSDVVRFWASTSRLGADTAYSEDVLKIGKKLVSKLWNATKFASIHLDKLKQDPTTPREDVANGVITETLDLWILSKLRVVIDISTQQVEKYEYCSARVAVEDFFWKDFCDNYLEFVKVRSYGEAEGVSEQMQQSAVCTIHHVLETLLRLFAPIIPHITEELYSHIFASKYAQRGNSIHAAGSWPQLKDYPEHDEESHVIGDTSVSILDAIRKLKADRNVSIKWPLENVYIQGVESSFDKAVYDLQHVSNARSVSLQAAESGITDLEEQKTEDGLYTVQAVFAEESDDVGKKAG